MKCTQCGGPVTLEDEFCPYCGALNKPARKHIEDMRRYGRDYEETKSEVMTNVRRQGTRHARIIAIVILVLVNIAVLVANIASDGISDALERLSLRRNAAAWEAQLQADEDNGDYAMLSVRYMRNNLYDGGDALELWYSEAQMAGDYRSAMEYIYYLATPELSTWQTDSEKVEYLANALSGFYETWSYKDSSYYAGQFDADRTAAMEDMESRLQASLKAYFGLTDEDLAALPDMSKQDMMLLLGRRTGIYE